MGGPTVEAELPGAYAVSGRLASCCLRSPGSGVGSPLRWGSGAAFSDLKPSEVSRTWPVFSTSIWINRMKMSLTTNLRTG